MEFELLVFLAQALDFLLHFQRRQTGHVGGLVLQLHEILLLPILERGNRHLQLFGQFSQSPAREQQLNRFFAERFGMMFLTLQVFHNRLAKRYTICPPFRGNLMGLGFAFPPAHQTWRERGSYGDGRK